MKLLIHRKYQDDIKVSPWLCAHIDEPDRCYRVLCLSPGRCEIDPALVGAMISGRVTEVEIDLEDGDASGKHLSLAGLRLDQIRHLAKMRDEMLGWAPVGFAVERVDDGMFISYDGPTGDIRVARIESESEAREWLAQQIADDAKAGNDGMYRLLIVYRKGDDDWDARPEET
jgi:hypothetical protein